MAAAKLDTLVPTGAPPPTSDTRVNAIVALAKALGGGPLFAGFVGGVIAVAGHSMLDTQRVVHRIERLEAAMIAADEHNAWVQEALVNLSLGEPLPHPRYRRISEP